MYNLFAPAVAYRDGFVSGNSTLTRPVFLVYAHTHSTTGVTTGIRKSRCNHQARLGATYYTSLAKQLFFYSIQPEYCAVAFFL